MSTYPSLLHQELATYTCASATQSTTPSNLMFGAAYVQWRGVTCETEITQIATQEDDFESLTR